MKWGKEDIGKRRREGCIECLKGRSSCSNMCRQVFRGVGRGAEGVGERMREILD